MSEEWIPVSLFIGITIVLCVVAWLRYRGRQDVQQTIRAALDKGQDLSPELIDRLGAPTPAKNKDLRLGAIFLSVAVGLALIGVAVPDPDAFRGTLAGAALPFCIGIAFLILHKMAGRE